MSRLARLAQRLWRLAGTAFSFTLFGLGGLFLGLLVFPALFALQRDPARRQVIARRCIGNGFAWFIAMMKFLGVLSYEVRHPERLENLSSTLIIANHPSLIDVVFLISFFPQAECVIKSAVTRNIFMRSTVAAANYISNENPIELLQPCTERLKQGANLVLFPEATRSVPGTQLQFKPGAAAIAARAGANILPIVITCSPTTLTKGEPWYHIPPTRPHWVLDVLPLRLPQAGNNHEESSRQDIRELNQQLQDSFQQALEATNGQS